MQQHPVSAHFPYCVLPFTSTHFIMSLSPQNIILFFYFLFLLFIVSLQMPPLYPFHRSGISNRLCTDQQAPNL